MPSLEDFDSISLTWSANDVNELLGETSYAKAYLTDDSIGFRRDYQTLKQNIPEFQQFSYSEYLWARLVVQSRAFQNDNNIALVPLADMMNHANRESSAEPIGQTMDWRFNHTVEVYQLRADRDVSAGEEVTITYNTQCNSIHLITYGFTLDQNTYNEVMLSVLVTEKDPSYGHHKERKIPLRMEIYRDHESPSISYFRYLLDPMYSKIKDPEHTMNLFVRPSTVEIEQRVLSGIHDICQYQLSQYSTTADEDANLLKTLQLGSRQRNVRNILHAEKLILQNCIETTKRMQEY